MLFMSLSPDAVGPFISYLYTCLIVQNLHLIPALCQASYVTVARLCPKEKPENLLTKLALKLVVVLHLNK